MHLNRGLLPSVRGMLVSVSNQIDVRVRAWTDMTNVQTGITDDEKNWKPILYQLGESILLCRDSESDQLGIIIQYMAAIATQLRVVLFRISKPVFKGSQGTFGRSFEFEYLAV